jgi:periplasmic divalent cation tolerance protein
MPSEYVVVNTTVEAPADAERLAEEVVAARLAACVQVGSVRSTYRWQGKVERADERLLSMKTTAALAARLVDFVRSRHPYEEPELVVLPIVGGSRSYLEWIGREVDPARE